MLNYSTELLKQVCVCQNHVLNLFWENILLINNSGQIWA